MVFLVDDKEIEQRWEHLQPSVKRQWSDKAESLIEVFEQLGYRKVTEPPLLSEAEIYRHARNGFETKVKAINLTEEIGLKRHEANKAVAEAQRQSDIKHQG